MQRSRTSTDCISTHAGARAPGHERHAGASNQTACASRPPSASTSQSVAPIGWGRVSLSYLTSASLLPLPQFTHHPPLTSLSRTSTCPLGVATRSSTPSSTCGRTHGSSSAACCTTLVLRWPSTPASWRRCVSPLSSPVCPQLAPATRGSCQRERVLVCK